MQEAVDLLFNKITSDLSLEGLVLTAKPCPAGILTIGYGHTGKDVTEGLTISKTRAKALLYLDIVAADEDALELSPGLRNESPEKLEAVIDFIFNLGREAYATSTLRKCIDAGDWSAAEDQINRWTHIRKNGKFVELKGLVIRREWEGNLLDPD